MPNIRTAFSALQACLLFFLFISIGLSTNTYAQPDGSASGRSVYDSIKAFDLNGGTAKVSGLTLKKDRVFMTFDGTFYFASPVEGKVTGAVFIGRGSLRAEAPPNDFEKANLRRLIRADLVESTFNTAVLRFSDDETFATIGKDKADGTADPQAVKLAAELNPRIMKETGANIAQRVAVSILNNEQPGGFFFANFDGGTRGRFSYLFDPQTRIPTNDFTINAGEKGLIFKYDSDGYGNDIWMAFYSQEDYAKGMVLYSDLFDMVDIANYDMDVDLTAPRSAVGLKARIGMKTRFAGIRMVTFSVGESLSEYEDQRLKKQMRVKSVKMGGADLQFVQEDWQGGFSVFLPSAMQQDKDLQLDIELAGDFIRQPQSIEDCHYPRSNTAWYPRHGYLDRAVYDMTFTHQKRMRIASVGVRQSEGARADNKDVWVTKYKMTHPVALVTFAMGPFERHVETIKWDDGSKPTPIEFSSMPGGYLAIKEDFILAELNNSVRFFHALFGPYPYDNYGGAFHPYGFGQGFPTMVMIPPTDRASKYTYSFLSHETAHQWWGNIVAWRSYRDQWLSEGFAEYSGLLYTSKRENPKAANNLLDQMRQSVKDPPWTETGMGKGRLNDVGPLVLGHRLSTRKTFGAYQALIYNKGGMVLRMLHFLLTDPSTGDDSAFYNMMKDFVAKHKNGVASSDDFRMVANAHFARTPIAQKFRLTDLNWFFRQWVYQTDLPSYKLQYTIENQPDGSVFVAGDVLQEGVPENFSMILPLVLQFGDGKTASGTVGAIGPKTPFRIKLPSKPTKVQLDPHKWILSEKTN